jgi:hypothetical protein
VAKLKSEPSHGQWVTIDGDFVRREVGNAVSTFVAPFRGAANAMIEASRSGQSIKGDPTKGQGHGGARFTPVYRVDKRAVGKAYSDNRHSGWKSKD